MDSESGRDVTTKGGLGGGGASLGNRTGPFLEEKYLIFTYNELA